VNSFLSNRSTGVTTASRVLVIAFDEATLPKVTQVLEEINSLPDLTLDWIAVTGLQGATTLLEEQLFDCFILAGDSTAPSLQLLRELQSYAEATPIVLVLNQAGAEDINHWLKAGIWEVLSSAELSPSLLAKILRHMGRVHQANQRIAQVERRLDISEQILQRQAQTIKEQAHQIQRLNRQLTEMAQLKSQFLSTVSHELRTPMNAVIGFSQLLLRQNRESSLKAQQRDMVERILSNAQRLLDMINGILNFAKIEAGQLQLKPQILNLTHLIQAVGQELQEVAHRKQLRLEINAHMRDPYIVNDPTWLQQIIFHLVSNALKFTQQGKVEISIQEAEDWLTVVVQDTGMGIQPAELEHIFEPFRQIDQTITRQHRGLGMGLALTGALVQQMGGTITVSSREGEGSTFQVKLPRRGAAAIKSTAASRPSLVSLK
jgi:signal transduction histidine kinase